MVEEASLSALVYKSLYISRFETHAIDREGIRKIRDSTREIQQDSRVSERARAGHIIEEL